MIRAGETLTLTDLHGNQAVDFLVYDAHDTSVRYSAPDTIHAQGGIFLTTGSVLMSNEHTPLMTVVADDVGRHDMFYGACSREMYAMQYGADDHPNCHDNLSAALRELGIDPVFLPQPFNFFMNVEIGEAGGLSIVAPRSRPGAAIELRAEMDLAVALSACPAGTCNGGAPPRPVGFEVLAD